MLSLLLMLSHDKTKECWCVDNEGCHFSLPIAPKSTMIWMISDNAALNYDFPMSVPAKLHIAGFKFICGKT